MANSVTVNDVAHVLVVETEVIAGTRAAGLASPTDAGGSDTTGLYIAAGIRDNATRYQFVNEPSGRWFSNMPAR